MYDDKRVKTDLQESHFQFDHQEKRGFETKASENNMVAIHNTETKL